MIPAPSSLTSDWRTYFDQFGPRLVLFARQWLPDVSDAEDVVQEAFVRFWRKHETPREEHAGLLFAAVRSVALDLIRRDTRRRRREMAASEGNFYAPGQAEIPPFFEEADLVVEGALNQLPAEQREVLVLKIWGELTFAQIGVALGISPNTASSRYRYSLGALRKLLHSTCHG